MSLSPGPQPQVIVLDTGGQYCHLIARKIRELGVYSEIRPSETPASELTGARAVVISGGPSSVYEPGSPDVDPKVFLGGQAVLGICYGQQLMARHLGGVVEKGEKGEYGLAHLERLAETPLDAGLPPRRQVWMSHRDTVTQEPPGFLRLAQTSTCAVAAMGDPARKLFAVQFHPEVVHTEGGQRVLENFLFRVAGCKKDWSPRLQIERIEDEIRSVTADRKVFFFVSGGVDSTVAFTLCLRALGPDRVRALYVDTGLMREGETAFVEQVLRSLVPDVFRVEHAAQRFLSALEGVTDPERKRHIIGEKFVEVQEQILESGHFLDDDWILGQGTIYPDTIESGGTAKADVIKTHHNRVAGIQRLISENRIVEPLHLLYKDEVREVGAALGLPPELLHRHPFPGPGLAIRCLCAERPAPLERLADGLLAPVRSVGVQGDSRTYRPILILPGSPTDPHVHETAAELINRHAEVNRVVAMAASAERIERVAVQAAALSGDRIARLRHADAIVRALSHESGFDEQVWQFPVILIPVGTPERPDSVVLRPIHSVDGMTARAVPLPLPLLETMSQKLLALPGICAVLLDLTHKPPGTIEWE